jgi:hypothetical protein
MSISSAFVLAVMLVDCLFFLVHHKTAAAWEANPIALFLLGFGPFVPVLFRAGSTCVALLALARVPTGPVVQLASYTVLLGVHAYLACIYVLILC